MPFSHGAEPSRTGGKTFSSNKVIALGSSKYCSRSENFSLNKIGFADRQVLRAGNRPRLWLDGSRCTRNIFISPSRVWRLRPSKTRGPARTRGCVSAPKTPQPRGPHRLIMRRSSAATPSSTVRFFLIRFVNETFPVALGRSGPAWHCAAWGGARSAGRQLGFFPVLHETFDVSKGLYPSGGATRARRLFAPGQAILVWKNTSCRWAAEQSAAISFLGPIGDALRDQATRRKSAFADIAGAGSAMIRRSSTAHACRTSRFSFTSRSSAWT